MIFSPTKLTFAAQTVNITSLPQKALLVNNGNQAVTITNITGLLLSVKPKISNQSALRPPPSMGDLRPRADAKRSSAVSRH